MAPVEPDALASNVKPIAIFATHAGVILGLISTIGRFYAKSQDDLPPAYHTRRREHKHNRNLIIFSVLAALGFLVTEYHAIAWRVASYRNWAYQRGVDAPGSLWQGWYANGDVKTTWQLGRWLDDVNIGQEIDSALTSSNRALWWSTQRFVSLVSWSIFVGLEGRHRNLPSYITYSFVLLAQILSLSTAVSLFFIALTLTPIPLPGATAARLTAPHPIQLLLPALWSFIYVFFIPVLQENTTAVAAAGLGYFVIPLLVCALAQPNYLHKITEHANIKSARLSYTTVFRILSWAGLTIHLVRSFYAALDNTPPTHELHHNFIYNDHVYEYHSLLNKVTTVISRIFGAVHSNPIVSGTAWDVLLTEASIFAWAASRGLDVRAILRSAGFWWSRETDSAIASRANAAYEAVEDTVSDLADKAISIKDKAVARVSSEKDKPRKTVESQFDEIVHAATEASSTGSHNLRASLRSSSVNPPDETPKKRTRGRAKKSTAAASPPPKSEAGEENDGGLYEPDAITQRELKNLTVLPREEDDIVEETEAGALAWALFAIGGLGVASAGVLGAEVSGGY